MSRSGLSRLGSPEFTSTAYFDALVFGVNRLSESAFMNNWCKYSFCTRSIQELSFLLNIFRFCVWSEEMGLLVLDRGACQSSSK